MCRHCLSQEEIMAASAVSAASSQLVNSRDDAIRTWRTSSTEEMAPRVFCTIIRAQHSHQHSDRPVKPPSHHLTPTEPQQRQDRPSKRASSLSIGNNKRRQQDKQPAGDALLLQRFWVETSRSQQWKGEHSWEGRRTKH